MSLSEKLMEHLAGRSFMIGGFSIPESVVVTWGIMAVLTIVSFLLTRNLQVVPTTKRQIYVETAVSGLTGLLEGILGKEGKRYVPYLATVLLYLGISNVIGVFGITPPTKDLNTTAALAIISIILIEFAGIHQKGVKGFLKSFAEPLPLLVPLNIMEIFIRPLSLCMRLFGNVLGAFILMELIKAVVPIGIPVIFSLYFDIFDGCLQAYIFLFLTALFIKESIE